MISHDLPQVTTLFHETGHGLQHMLTTVPHKPAAGIEGVEWDAVELPSQFMENWCYDAKTVYDAGMARHHETGEPLPRELFEKLCAQKTYQARRHPPTVPGGSPTLQREKLCAQKAHQVRGHRPFGGPLLVLHAGEDRPTMREVPIPHVR